MYNNIMTQGFFQFNNTIINEILNFTTSTFDLFFINGEKGSSKSESISKLLDELNEKNLVFQHFCFKNSVINDFLLNFYDSFRTFSIAQKISLKKFTTDNFENKITHYFKTIEMPCLIIVENFECIEKNVEIVNFLSHIAAFENVKIIILSRNSNKNLFRFKQLKIKTYEIEKISKNDFKEKLTILSKPYKQEFCDKFYEITNGIELYIKMSAKFASTTDIDLMVLVDEYERRKVLSNITFEEFLVSKFVSLIPASYLDFYKTLCIFSHPVSKEFLNKYNLGNLEYIKYLLQNMLISGFANEIYVKDYFKEYILKTFSIQEKLNRYSGIIEIYEQELTKSPKDRLIRLSRESIRKEIELFNSLIPSINTKTKNSMPYLGFNSMVQKQEKKSKLAEKLEKIKERKNKLTLKPSSLDKEDLIKRQEQIKKQQDRQFVINLINSSRDFEKQYKYKDAISELVRAQENDTDKEFAIEILILLAKNYEFLNNINLAQKCYVEALKISIENNDSRKTQLEFLIAQTNKKLYKINVARTQFEQIAYDEKNSTNYRAKSFIELGEIHYANSKNTKEAIKQYERAINLVVGKNKQLACSAYYRLAVLYDENNDYDNAIKYYQKNYLTSSEKDENRFYSISLTNLAQIYIELSQHKQARHFLKLALQFDSENNDFENIYFSQIELAKLSAIEDINNAIGYYKHALETARKLNDSFKEALTYFEVAKLYYDKQNDEKALINFLNAKIILKDSNQSENLSRINESIKDIKMRLDSNTFNYIMEKYDKK